MTGQKFLFINAIKLCSVILNRSIYRLAIKSFWI